MDRLAISGLAIAAATLILYLIARSQNRFRADVRREIESTREEIDRARERIRNM